MEGISHFFAITVDHINSSVTPATTDLFTDFIAMLEDQEIQCHSEAGEIVPNSLDELVDYLDIGGVANETELSEYEGKLALDFGQFRDFSTFNSEDRWHI